jgi:glycosyltransferase involved in cell wall biosynthesis
MAAMQILTLATPATLPQTRVLARSLCEHQPDWPHEVVVVAPEGWSQAPGEQLRVRSAAEVLGLDVEPLIGRHEEQDLIALLLPRLLEAYSKRAAGPALHLPPSAWVLGDLEPVASALGEHSVMLVPRMTGDVPADGLEPSDAQMERMGRMAETVIAVDGTPGAAGFLSWWGGHLEQALGSADGLEGGGRPEDRPWLARLLELAPARFATAVLEDPGCNLSAWNLHEHTLGQGETGVLVDGRWPLRFMDLAGFEPDRPHRLSAMATRARVSRSPALRELCARYAEELERAGWRAADHRRDVGRTMADGVLYDEALHSLHVRALALGAHLEDVFAPQGAAAFAAWLQGPAPRGAAHGLTRYAYYRVARERPDVLRAYPDLDGRDGAECVAWCWAFGREEMGIPDRFMPPRPGETPAGRRGATEEQSSEVFAEEQSLEAADRRAVWPQATTAQSVGLVPGRGASESEATTWTGHNGAGLPGVAEGSPPAVRVTGYLSHTLGLGAAARGYAQALAAAGVPVSTASVPLHHLELPVELEDGYGRHGFEDVALHHTRHELEIVAVNPDELPSFVERLGEEYFHGPRIGVWGWETNSIPSRWRRAFGLVQEIWVYSHFMAGNIGAVAPVPVIALPPPVTPPSEEAAPTRLGIPDDGFLFLFVFDYLSTIQRKNPVGLVEAFKRAFAPGEGPRLMLKTINAPLRPLAEEEVLWAAHGRPDVYVVDRSLGEAQLNGVMAACDCYVSLHRSEGFGLTLAEAMAIGKPVIGTGYSGNLDFMTPENSYLVEYELGRVGPDCEIYPADGEWAQPSVEHAAQLMRYVYENPEEAAAVGARAREDVARELSPQATGAAMRRRLAELPQPVGGV